MPWPGLTPPLSWMMPDPLSGQTSVTPAGSWMRPWRYSTAPSLHMLAMIGASGCTLRTMSTCRAMARVITAPRCSGVWMSGSSVQNG
jgi:hypothetical protein